MSTPNLDSSAQIRSAMLVQHFGEIANRASRDYLRYLAERLGSAAQRTGIVSQPHFSFRLLDSFDPLAFSPGGGEVLFSRGLVLNLSNEAELAFVLAHELAHQTLGHIALLPAQDQLNTAENLLRSVPNARELELAADRQALGTMISAGYDPHYAPSALVKAYRAANLPDAQDETHPDLSSRLSALSEALASARWQPPGTVNRWDFQRLRVSLARG